VVLALQKGGAMLASSVLACILQAEAAAPAGRPEDTQGSPLNALKGSLAVRYRFRETKGVEDNDLYQFLQLRWGDPELDPVSASLSVRFAEDLDRPESSAGFHPFASLDATYSHSATGRLYTAYVDVHPEDWGLRLRAGRLVVDDLPEMLPLDGALLRTSNLDLLDAAIFAGLPVNLFESSPEGDLAYGGWAGVAPWARGRLRAEYLHLEDETVFGAFDDDLIGAAFEQGAGAFLLGARHTWLEGEGREATLRLSGAFPDLGLALDLRTRYAYERQQALSYALDPYATFLFDVEPYLELGARLSQALGRHVGVDAGLLERRLVRGGEEGAYNHEFTRWTLAPRVDAWPWEALSVSASVDFWESTRDDFWTAGGDATLRLHPRVSVGAATSYALYMIDALSGEERERVRTFSGLLRWTLDDGTRIDLRFTHEENELGTWRVLEVGVRHAF
jgi:hypothetical protein